MDWEIAGWWALAAFRFFLWVKYFGQVGELTSGKSKSPYAGRFLEKWGQKNRKPRTEFLSQILRIQKFRLCLFLKGFLYKSKFDFFKFSLLYFKRDFTVTPAPLPNPPPTPNTHKAPSHSNICSLNARVRNTCSIKKRFSL